jgi:hypothetical protein
MTLFKFQFEVDADGRRFSPIGYDTDTEAIEDLWSEVGQDWIL